MKYLVGLFSILFYGSVIAQDISSSVMSNPDLTFCQPGVCNKSPGKGLLIDYRTQPSFNYTDGNISGKVAYNSRFLSKIKIPFVIKPGLKILLGFNYEIEKYRFEDATAIADSPLFRRLNETALKTARISAYVSKPLNQKYYLTFKFDALYAGDYEDFMDFDGRYATYRGVGIFGFKKSDNIEYGIGLLAQKSFRNKRVLPFGFYNRTFNDKWGVEFALPLLFKVRHNFNDKNLVLFGPEYNSRSYSIDVETDATTIFHYRRQAIELAGVFMHNLRGWAWVQAKIGYAENLNTAVRNTFLGEETNAKPNRGIYGSVGFFLSPPSKKKR